jgi:hypothetical protein
MKKAERSSGQKRKHLVGAKKRVGARTPRRKTLLEDYPLSNFEIAPGFELAAVLDEREARIDLGVFDLNAGDPRIHPQDCGVYNVRTSPKELLLLSFELARVALLAYSRTSTIL